MTYRISPDAVAAREAARRAGGEFGVQAHTPPDERREGWAGDTEARGMAVLDRLDHEGGRLEWAPQWGQYRLVGANGRTEPIRPPAGSGTVPGSLEERAELAARLGDGALTYREWCAEHTADPEEFLEARRGSGALRRMFGDERAARIAGVDSWVGSAVDGRMPGGVAGDPVLDPPAPGRDR